MIKIVHSCHGGRGNSVTFRLVYYEGRLTASLMINVSPPLLCTELLSQVVSETGKQIKVILRYIEVYDKLINLY